VKGRSHPTTSKNNFENSQLGAHYNQYIQYLMYKPNLNNSDLLNLTIYAINQLKIELAIRLFSIINEKDLPEKLQYDYLNAYLAFYQNDLATAEIILLKYKELSIIQWKERFAELEIQLKEIKTGIIDEKSRSGKFSSTVLADKESSISAKLNLNTIDIAYKNSKEAKVEFYEMDLEILFSNSPFEVMNKQIKFITIPNFSESISLNANTESYNFKIPDSLEHKNLVIKISSAGKNSIVTYYPSKLDITISENYGELRVLSKETKKAISAVYIKVYGKKETANEFIKDGYTDLRGVFNYSSVSGKQISQYSEIAILVLSDKFGASVHYVNPPTH
jgi:hypothetical protein